jgi:hypothetical protein
MFASSGVGAFAGYTVGQVAPAGDTSAGCWHAFDLETVLRN